MAIALAIAPTLAEAQRNRAPLPRLLVPSFKTVSGEAKLGIEVADAIRDRARRGIGERNMMVLTREQINQFLTGSGYQPDSSLTRTDLRDLGKVMSADESVDGTITRLPDGTVRADARMFVRNNLAYSEGLPAAVGKDAGTVGRSIADSYMAARKQLDEFQRCENALRDDKPAEAIAAANAGIAAHGGAVLSRLCLLWAYGAQKQNDSVIAVAQRIVAIDSMHPGAWANLAEAYKAKGENDKYIESSIRVYRLDPSPATIETIIAGLANAGAPEKALPLIDDLLTTNPGDPAMLRTKWQLLLRAERWKDAIAAGEEMVRMDSSTATADFFTRMAGAATNDSQPQLVAQFLARGTQKFPADVGLQLAYAQELRRAGQLQQALEAAKRVVAADPKDSRGYAYTVLILADLGQADSAVAYATRAVEAGADKATVAGALTALISPAAKKAQASKSREDWEAVLTVGQQVDALAPSGVAKFYVGLSAFQVAAEITQALQKTKSCPDARRASDLLGTAQLAMSQGGGQVDANTAGQIMTSIPQVSDYLNQWIKASCK